MKFIKYSLLASTLFVGTAMADGAHWGYDGEVSPEHWGELSEDFAACSTGKHQSPINIMKPHQVTSKHITYHYDIQPENVVNNGHTVQVNITGDDDYLILDDDTYYLKQFHFHTPSENQFDGKHFPLEAHFVHADKEGKLLVLAVMMEYGDKNKELDKAWDILSPEEGKEVALKDPIDVYKMLPEHKSYYHFEGSLTTPPCTEGVQWYVLKEPTSVSKEQVEKFEKLLHHHNNRPVQPLNDRQIDND